DRQRPPAARPGASAAGHGQGSRGATGRRPSLPYPAHGAPARTPGEAAPCRPEAFLRSRALPALPRDCGCRRRGSRVHCMNFPVRGRRVSGLAGVVLVALAAACQLLAAVPPPAGSATDTAAILEINGAIGPATSRYIVRALEAARKNGSRLVVLEMD